jgi:hypothetical protein
MSRQQAQALDIALDRLIDEAQRQLQADGLEQDYWCCEEPQAPLRRCERCDVLVCKNCDMVGKLCENCHEYTHHFSRERWD